MDDQSYTVTAGEQRQFIEQYEQLDLEKKDITERQKDVMAEAKGRGYDTKVMRKIMPCGSATATTSWKKMR